MDGIEAILKSKKEQVRVDTSLSGIDAILKKKERKPKEISLPLISEKLGIELKRKITKPFEKVEKRIERIGRKVITRYKELEPDFETLKGELQKTSAEIPSRVLYEPINKIVDFIDTAIDSAGQFVADPSEYDEEGNLTLFPKIRGTMLLGALVVEGTALAGGMKAGLAYRKSMQTFEKWRKTLGERRLKVEFDKYLKSTKFKDVQRNMRTFFERITKWFRRKPRPVGERLGREIRFRGRLPEIEKKELFAMREETAIKNIEQTMRQAGQIDRNLKKAGFKVERPAYYLKTEQKPFITDNIIAVKNIPTAEGGKGVALANIETGSVQLFKNPLELKQELIRLSLDNITRPVITKPARKDITEMTKRDALMELAEIKEEVKDLDSRVTTSATIGKSIEEKYKGSPELKAERDALKARELELIPKAYPETAEKVRPEELVKRPWEMTKEEFGINPMVDCFVHVGKDVDTLKPTGPKNIIWMSKGAPARYAMKGDATYVIDPSKLDTSKIVGEEITGNIYFGYKGEISKEAFIKVTQKEDYKPLSHKSMVQAALSEGKTVPFEVLKDYPDLERRKVIGEKKLIKEVPKEKIRVYEQVGLRRLERYEIDRVVEDLEMTAGVPPAEDKWIKYSVESVVGTLPKEEMDAAIIDVKAYIEKPTEQSIETMLDGAGKVDENSFPEEWARWRELGKRWEQLSAEEKTEFWEIADKISDRVSEGVIPPDEMLGFPLGDLKEDWKLSGIKGFLSTAGGVLPYGLDVHAWFPKQAIKSARAVKTMHTKQEMMHKKGEWIIRQINRAGKKAGVTIEDYQEALLPASQRALLKDYSPEQQKKFNAIFEITDKVFKEELAMSKKKGIVSMGFVERVAREAKENIKQYLIAMKEATTSARKADLETRLKEEQEVLEFIKKMDVRYVHLPVRLLFEQLWQNPAIKRYLKFSRFFRRRETLDVASWIRELRDKRYPEAVRNTRAIKREIKEGTARLEKGNIDTDTELVVSRPLMDKSALDIRRIIAAYYGKLGRLYGLADIVNAFQHDGLIRDLPATGIIPDGWNTLPSGLFPEFKGKIAKGVVADWLQQYLRDVFKKGIGLNRLFAYFKLMQFTRLFFMPFYDVYQASIHWGLRWALTKPHKVPVMIARAIKSFVKKDEHFWNFWNYGGPSKPFAAPFISYMNEVEVLLQETGLKKLARFVAHHYQTPVDFLYIPIWTANWGGDELVRLISYHAALEEGQLPEEAAQLAATVHSDYARMPAKTRRLLNKIFFVPVFPVTMALWEYEMMKAAVLESMRIGAKGLGKVFPPIKKLEAKLTPSAEAIRKRRKSMAKGLLGLLGVVALREGVQKALGFKKDVLSLRYIKMIDDPDNPGQQKELVKYIPTPDNVLLRHIFRWRDLPSEPDQLKYISQRLSGIVHPFPAYILECIRNRKRDFTPITERSRIWDGPAGWARMGLDYLAYAGERLIPILKSVPGLATEYQEERKKAIREWRRGKGPYWVKRIMEPFIFLYMRNTEDQRGIRQAKEFLRLIRQEAREAERIKGGPLSEKEVQRYIDRVQKMEDALLNLSEGREPARTKTDMGVEAILRRKR